MTLLYPTLPGLTYSVIKRQIGGSTAIARAASGREVRVGYWTYPMWEWDLTYEYLPDMQANGATINDLQTLVGFVGNNCGALSAFQFLDPDDSSRTGVVFAAGDGSTKTFQITVSTGVGSGYFFQPIGYINTSLPIRVYLNGVLQTYGSAWTYSTTYPYAQTITFATAPASGVAIGIDVSYYYMARIKEDTVEYEKFMNKLWAVKKITLVSLKGS